jgi:hypothetical protein
VNDENKKSQLFSMDLRNIEVLLDESEQQLDFTENYLSYYLNLDIVHHHLVCTLCEYYSVNYALSKEIKLCLEYNAQVDREDKKEIVLTSQNIKILESAALSRYVLIKQLTDYNVSTYMH